MNEQDKPSEQKTSLIGAPVVAGSAHVWVPVIVASISAVSAIGAALIMKPSPSPTPAPTTQESSKDAATDPAPAPQPGPGPASTSTPASGVDYRAQVLGYLDTQHKPLTDAGYARDEGTDDWVGLLDVGTPKVWEVQLVRGVDYQAVGVCDSDCKNVDMEIYDPGGHMIGADTLVDDYPRVAFSPAQSGPHTIKVWLRDCTAANGSHSCVVAVRLLRR